MHSIDGNNITLTRGDTLFLEISMQKGGEPFTPETGSAVRFAMKKKYTDVDSAALVKEIPIDTMVFEIKPEDTKRLQMKKTYVYDIQYTDADGHVDTFISGTFTIAEEVI